MPIVELSHPTSPRPRAPVVRQPLHEDFASPRPSLHHSEQLLHRVFHRYSHPRGRCTDAALLRATKHCCGSAEFAPDGRRSAQAAAPRRAWRKSTANCRSNRPRGDLRRSKVVDFWVRGPHGVAGSRAPSSSRRRREARNLMPDNPCARHLVPNRDPATRQRHRPAIQIKCGAERPRHFSSDCHTSAQNVAPSHARPITTAATS